jgi:hypothetical protein
MRARLVYMYHCLYSGLHTILHMIAGNLVFEREKFQPYCSNWIATSRQQASRHQNRKLQLAFVPKPALPKYANCRCRGVNILDAVYFVKKKDGGSTLVVGEIALQRLCADHRSLVEKTLYENDTV